MPSSPAIADLTYPAEWERHEATWIGWPHRAADWPGKFAAIPWAFAELVRHVAEGERVRLLVQDARHEAAARRVLAAAHAPLAQVDFARIRTDRGWTRDFGPLFLRRAATGERAILDYRFNGWAKYPEHRLDDAVAARVARARGLPCFPLERGGCRVVLEGGGLDVNGRGTLITTEECFLDQAVQCRNPGFNRADMEAVFRDGLGQRNVLWFGRGIAGDDTHGHVDDLCRFVSADTVVLASEDDSSDANYAALQENRERAAAMRLENGSRLNVVQLPMPRPLCFRGQRLPASYANFYFCNAAVLVPTFNDPRDREALGLLSELITDRPVIGLHALDLVWGLGTLHCLTREEPAAG